MIAPQEDKRLNLPTKQQSRDLETVRGSLQRWLTSHFAGAAEVEITDLRLPRGSGLSNETLVFNACWRQDGVRRSGGYVVRIDTHQPLFPASNAQRQYSMCRALANIPGIPVPAVLGFESSNHWLGAPFFLMERVEGRVPADDPPFHHQGWVTELSTDERARMWRSSVRVMAQLHAVDSNRFSFLKSDAESDGLRQNVNYYIEQFDSADSHPIIDAARLWLLANYPGARSRGLSWGDARVGNMIFREGLCVAVLDWDMVSLAGAEADLAWWAMFDQSNTTSVGISRLPGFGTPREMIALWEEYSGRRVRDFDWHLVFACYRVAVIVRRLARMLKQAQLLPAASEYLEHDNAGVQYLTTLLRLKPAAAITMPWPGLN
jgi:aminoglycoside phosphotransferase (APT) family kinase protein